MCFVGVVGMPRILVWLRGTCCVCCIAIARSHRPIPFSTYLVHGMLLMWFSNSFSCSFNLL